MGSNTETTDKESWLGGLWRRRKDLLGLENEVVGILSFEVVSLMSKVVRVWHCLSDAELLRLKTEIFRSAGVRNLVSKDENSLMAIVQDEILETVVYVARAVVRLGKRCSDPMYQRIEQLFFNPLQHREEWSEWAYKWKKMERRAKKMERFIGAMIQLYEKREALAECEQILRRLKVNPEQDRGKVFEFQQKVKRRRQEVQGLRELSPWCRSYDYIVRLLLRSIATILEKMARTSGGGPELSAYGERNLYMCLSKNYSIPSLVPSLLYPSVYNFEEWCVGPIPEKNCIIKRQNSGHSQFLSATEKNTHPQHLSQVTPFKGCMLVATDSPIITSHKSSGGANLVVGDDIGIWNEGNMQLLFAKSKILWRISTQYSRQCLFSPPPGTLGHAAMAVHYANIIVRIEKLANSPDSVRLNKRDDLYEMLPFPVRNALRTSLRPMIRDKSTARGLDTVEAEKQRCELIQMLQWICPPAHNTIKWFHEQGFEKQVPGSTEDVLLVQTLYFADQAKTEAAIVRLLVSLSLLSRGRQ
ncbi:hypothetical protein MLD38_032515 [Melastoma candidum]|uniref:Uncharacterized protein n=1 Tax=Melastoma candidum TaxID=119954 RepID=A0ACB9M7H1_9MYRT|nr:hypothetical protein MLD38_032515 [Melastoma candidum]